MAQPQVPEGMHVTYYHKRKLRYGVPRAKGGRTTAFVYDNVTGELVVSGTAVCMKTDNYDKRIGRNIALGKALKALEEVHDPKIPSWKEISDRYLRSPDNSALRDPGIDPLSALIKKARKTLQAGSVSGVLGRFNQLLDEIDNLMHDE